MGSTSCFPITGVILKKMREENWRVWLFPYYRGYSAKIAAKIVEKFVVSLLQGLFLMS